MKNKGVFFLIICLLFCMSCKHAVKKHEYKADTIKYIKPWKENPRYWQFNGLPILLKGGSKDDNLFQIPDLSRHLDQIVEAGGNYVRNALSSRQEKGFEVQPFEYDDEQYNLEQWNEIYWQRLEKFLKETEKRDIVVQIELWAFNDFNKKYYDGNPWNPD